jgi:hypothetical protein
MKANEKLVQIHVRLAYLEGRVWVLQLGKMAMSNREQLLFLYIQEPSSDFR